MSNGSTGASVGWERVSILIELDPMRAYRKALQSISRSFQAVPAEVAPTHEELRLSLMHELTSTERVS